MKNELYQEMYKTYLQGYSLQEVGSMYGMTRQSVFEGFRVRKLKLREKKKLPFLVFNGIKFTLRNNGYYSRTDGDRGLMHRYVWEFYKSKIPAGYDIHHIDHNKENNKIENLELYTKAEHSRKFATGVNQYSKSRKHNR